MQRERRKDAETRDVTTESIEGTERESGEYGERERGATYHTDCRGAMPVAVAVGGYVGAAGGRAMRINLRGC
jgi:hypothetical protein